MTKVKIQKGEIDKLMKITGNANGSLLKALHRYILSKKGQEGVSAVEERLAGLGYPLKFVEVNSFTWYPAVYISLICLVILEVFNWDEEKAYDIGHDSPLYSILTRLLIKYIASLDMLFGEIPKYWRKHYDFGNMEGIRLDQENKYVIMRLNGFKKIHPIWYVQAKGYLARLVGMCTQGKDIKVEQTKSIYNSDSYDEFKISWQ